MVPSKNKAAHCSASASSDVDDEAWSPIARLGLASGVETHGLEETTHCVFLFRLR